MPDFIMNGQATGDAALALMANDMNPSCLRPYIGNDGRHYIDVVQNGEVRSQLTNNANATLRKDDWMQLDTAVIKAAQPRLRAVGDLRAAGLQYTMRNGMAHYVLQHQTQSDVSPAIISMDGLRQSDNDRPEFTLENLPLPLIHKDFSIPTRQLMASRNGGSPLDLTMAELAGRRVAIEAENLQVGVAATYKYGGGTVYGYVNYPSRLTKTMTAPTSTNQKTTLDEVLQMKTQSQAANHFGPWFCYCSTSWDEFMDNDFSTAYPGVTLRQRLGNIEGIDTPRTLDYLPANTIILVQKSSDVARTVVGMDITTVQWESHGGMKINFKVMAILVPQLRADANSNTGIVHGTHP